MLASVAYSARETSSKRSSPFTTPRRSSTMPSRCPILSCFQLMELLSPQFFLAIPLAHGEVKEFTLGIGRKPLILGLTTVTHRHVSHRQIKGHVDQGGADQNTPGEVKVIHAHRHDEAETGCHDNAHSQPMRKRF